ncbi:MAG: tetratricopeptide repeat protein [bacterium]|nr:tetratricopeptide repeat protein [bacterium]
MNYMLFGLMLFLQVQAKADTAGTVHTIGFADWLYETQDYNSAITEYKALLRCSSNDTLSLFRKIGKSYLSLEENNLAYKCLSRLTDDTAYTLIGISSLKEDDIESAEQWFMKVEDESLSLKLQAEYSKFLNLSYKSPATAGFLSAIVPGLGRAYAGRTGDGIFSFILTIGSAAVSYRYFQTKDFIPATIFGGLGLSFYFGNIYGSKESVKLYNEKVFEKEFYPFKQRFINSPKTQISVKEDTSIQWASSRKAFADTLFNEGKYDNAILEYKRLNFFAPDSHSQYRIGQCYEKAGDLKNAVRYYEKAGSCAYYDLIGAHLKSGDYSSARFVCDDLINGKELRGWIYILEDNYDDASECFEDSEFKQKTNQFKLLPYKSEDKAVLLSTFIPGSGEFYTHNFKNGLLTLLFNGITGVLAVKSFHEHRYLDGTLITMLLWNRFYEGGMKNALTSVTKYNEILKQKHLKELEKYAPEIIKPIIVNHN